MEKITFEDYKAAVLEKFDKVRKNDPTSMLHNLTPAAIRDYCILIAGNTLSQDDANTIRTYFDIPHDADVRKGIERFGLGRMKSLVSFLSGENDSFNSKRTELAAVLADFRPRPYSRYIKNGNGCDAVKEVTESPKIDEEDKEKAPNHVTTGFTNDTPPRLGPRRKVPGKIYIGLLVVLFLVVSGYIFEKSASPKCLQWANDHYETVECAGTTQGFMYVTPQLKYDERLLEFRKIEVSDTTTFFKYGQPVVWYLKKNGKCEFFNAPGMHPVYDKPLKPVTEYIYKKYVKAQSDNKLEVHP